MPAYLLRKALYLVPLLLAGIAHAVPPVLTEVTPILPKLKDTTPNYTFHSDQAGTIQYSGACSSSQTAAVAGNNTITLNQLPLGTYNDCALTVTNGGGEESAVLAIPQFQINWAKVPGANPKLNDTGVVLCGDYAYNNSLNHNNNLDCSATGVTKTTDGTDGDGDPVPAGQDALYGRDSDPATNSNDDGWAGFSFTKLDANGDPLAIQNGTYSESGSEMAGTKWSCVKDNVTGLTWEIKTDDGGLRDKDWTYTYYKPNWQNRNAPYQGYAYGSKNMCVALGDTYCNTHQYVKDVNAVGLCGHHDWRMPTAYELVSLINFETKSQAIDTNYFSDAIGVVDIGYWSSSINFGGSKPFFLIMIWGANSVADATAEQAIRLVRDE